MLIDGKAIAADIQKEIKLFVDQQEGIKPCLAVLIVGDHAPSLIYVNRKIQACAGWIGDRSGHISCYNRICTNCISSKQISKPKILPQGYTEVGL